MNFSQALILLKAGSKIARAGWGGYWTLECIDGLAGETIVATLKGSKERVPATPYQLDILAEDWVIVL